MQQPRLPFETAPSLPPPSAAIPLTPPPGPVTYPPPVFVRHRKARRYIVRVTADGAARVTIPSRGSKREAQEFLTSQSAWVERQRRRLADAVRDLPPAIPAEEVARGRERALRDLPPRLLELAAQFGLTVTRVTIRNQRWRWGSCSRRGAITLNWRLVTMPDWVRDYVLIHELMHLKRMDHSPKFWALVAEACPRYQEARAWLRTASM